jgi:luciferase family oxidoreductase group 1
MSGIPGGRSPSPPEPCAAVVPGVESAASALKALSAPRASARVSGSFCVAVLFPPRSQASTRHRAERGGRGRSERGEAPRNQAYGTVGVRYQSQLPARVTSYQRFLFVIIRAPQRGLVSLIPLSVLDLAPIVEGGDAAASFRNSLDLAQHAERWGYRRFWLAEHHNIPSVASAATSVLIAYVAGGTSTIRVGAGGIMLPNHPPLVIAEQFGTLVSLYPGRIDLGLGRAPGSDQLTAHALRRAADAGDAFPDDVLELMAYFQPAQPGHAVRAVPGEGLDVPIWILGSSTFGAQLAASLGLPFAFASHFAPAMLERALDAYRTQFRPSRRLDRPYVMLGVNVFAADSETEARRLFTSLQQAFINLRRGRPGPLRPPVEAFAETLQAFERAMLDDMLSYSVVGTGDDVAAGLDTIVARTGADELMIASQIFDHSARLQSYEITASALGLLPTAGTPP